MSFTCYWELTRKRSCWEVAKEPQYNQQRTVVITPCGHQGWHATVQASCHSSPWRSHPLSLLSSCSSLPSPSCAIPLYAFNRLYCMLDPLLSHFKTLTKTLSSFAKWQGKEQKEEDTEGSGTVETLLRKLTWTNLSYVVSLLEGSVRIHFLWQLN